MTAPRTVPAWDEYFMRLAQGIALRSKDRSTQVGCVIVGPDNEIRSTGYNSFPRGMDDHHPERHERPEKYKWTEHAERNAIYNAARVGTPLKGCRVYCGLFPCMDCARAIVSVGCTEVIAVKLDPESDLAKRWEEEFVRVGPLFEETGVTLRWIDAPDDQKEPEVTVVASDTRAH